MFVLVLIFAKILLLHSNNVENTWAHSGNTFNQPFLCKMKTTLKTTLFLALFAIAGTAMAGKKDHELLPYPSQAASVSQPSAMQADMINIDSKLKAGLRAPKENRDN